VLSTEQANYRAPEAKEAVAWLQGMRDAGRICHELMPKSTGPEMATYECEEAILVEITKRMAKDEH